MRLNQIDEKHTPDKFFLSRIVDEGLETEHLVYDVEVENTTEVVADDRIASTKKRVFGGGIAEFILYADHYEIHFNGTRVASGFITARVWHNDAWVTYDFDFNVASRTKIGDRTFRCIRTVNPPFGEVNFGLTFSFGKGINSQEFYLDAPGKFVGIRWRIEVLSNALKENREDGRGLTFGADDDDAVHTEPVHADPDNWEYHQYVYGGETGWQCDPADERTAVERYQADAGLKV